MVALWLVVSCIVSHTSADKQLVFEKGHPESSRRSECGLVDVQGRA